MIHEVRVFDASNNLKYAVSGKELTRQHWAGFKDCGVDSIHRRNRINAEAKRAIALKGVK